MWVHITIVSPPLRKIIIPAFQGLQLEVPDFIALQLASKDINVVLPLQGVISSTMPNYPCLNFKSKVLPYNWM